MHSTEIFMDGAYTQKRLHPQLWPVYQCCLMFFENLVNKEKKQRKRKD